MEKLAIIGASYLQEPLIQKAKERGIETHVFAWECGDVGEKIADFFYPISITEKELILQECQRIGIDGICSIASDLAVITVNYVAEKMGLTGNTIACANVATNKRNMRLCFERRQDPSPRSILIDEKFDISSLDIDYPVIVKPVDRSGSRGITKVESFGNELISAIENAKAQGFSKVALVEEYVSGKEYSVEFLSWKGRHRFLALTQKYTTGAPHFIENGHIEPANVENELLEKVKTIVAHALDSLGVEYGASHSEIKITEAGEIKLIEIGARMGGDCIGSSLVELTTGFDFVNGVIDVALGIEPDWSKIANGKQNAAIRFIFSKEDLECLEKVREEHPEVLVEENVKEILGETVTDSSSRYGYFIMKSCNRELLEKYMPSN